MVGQFIVSIRRFFLHKMVEQFINLKKVKSLDYQK